jgi:acyl homoserine lactone synthase
MTIQFKRLTGAPWTADHEAMFRLRHGVFIERLGWDLPAAASLETDGYDTALTHYLVAFRDEVCIGCWRLLPTTGPYMLSEPFAALLQGAAAPCDATVWELSRFAIRGDVQHAFGFGDAARAMFSEVHRFALEHRIARYVTVTTLGIERMLRHAGVPCERLGRPQRLGESPAVAILLRPEDLGRVGAAEPRTLPRPTLAISDQPVAGHIGAA